MGENKTRHHSRAREAHVLGLATLAAWLGIILWLLIEGRYTLYLMPRLGPLLVLALVVLAVCLLAKLVLRRTHGHARNRIDTWVKPGILLLPLLFLAINHGESLGAFAFDKRRVMELSPRGGLDSTTLPQRPVGIDGRDDVILETDLLSLHWNHVQFLGAKVRVLARVARDERLPDGRFILFRFVVLCCVADAQPLAMLADIEGTEIPPEDAWVQATGYVETVEVEGRTSLIIRCDELQRANPPAEHYLFAF
jgi:uncharacterized repeat protein (TIGR03943 family)